MAISKEIIINELPPNIDCETVPILKALYKASRALGELRGEVKKIPNSQILIDTLVLLEAKDSNEIENIVTTDDELYQASIDEKLVKGAAKEAQNYAKAIKTGYEIIQTKGIFTINDLKKIQSLIAPNHPIRKIPGTHLKNPLTQEVVFTPPQNPNEINKLLNNLELYINNPDTHKIDSLIKMPIIHYQFESIHPFYDGNGRTGRLLNILYLVHQELMDIPVLYLSSYIIKHKTDYYRLLQSVRLENTWEEWIIWMLNGVEETSRDTMRVVNAIKTLMDKYKKIIKKDYTFYSHDLINVLFKHPYTKIDFIKKELNVHRHTATTYLNQLTEGNLLMKIKIGRTNYYINTELMSILKSR